jgi:hypothetical protein
VIEHANDFEAVVELLEGLATRRIIFTTPNWPYFREGHETRLGFNEFEAHQSYVPREFFKHRGYQLRGAGWGRPTSGFVRATKKLGTGAVLFSALPSAFPSLGESLVAYKDWPRATASTNQNRRRVPPSDAIDPYASGKTMKGAKRPSVILGMAEGFDWEGLQPFVESIRRTSFSGEVHLFVAGVDDRTMDILRHKGIVLHPFTRIRFERGGRVFHPYDPPLRRFYSAKLAALYPPILHTLASPSRDPLTAQARLAAPISIPYVARFLRYYRFLRSTGTRYANVMLTDVRDVFFQRDPFDFDVGDSVNCFLEDESRTLATEPHNRNWLVEAYGKAVLRTLGDKAISCSGVTIGPRERILAYLEVMTRELLKLSHQATGIDQGVHNYVLHQGLVPSVRLIRNGEGPVLTLALVPRPEIEAAMEKGSLDANVLHQYYRHPRLSAALLGQVR